MYLPDHSLFWALTVSAFVHTVLIVLPFGTVELRKYPSPLHVVLPKPVRSESTGPAREALTSPVPSPQSLSKPSDIVELTSPPDHLRLLAKTESGLPVSPAKTQKARLLNPEWLDEAWALPPQARGNVVVSLKIDASGQIESIEVEPGGAEFSDWIRDELPKRARFSPALQDGIPISSAVRVRLNLEPLLH